jgi:hypothetical protein
VPSRGDLKDSARLNQTAAPARPAGARSQDPAGLSTDEHRAPWRGDGLDNRTRRTARAPICPGPVLNYEAAVFDLAFARARARAFLPASDWRYLLAAALPFADFL